MVASTIFEDDQILVQSAPAAEGVRSPVAVLSYSPMNHDFAAKGIPARAALQSLNFDVFGIIAKKNNWYPQSSVEAAAVALRPLLGEYSQKIAYGSSMGAYGAIKYSALMGCDHVLALAPQYSIDPADVPWDTRFRQHFRSELNTGMGIATGDVSGRVIVVTDPMLRVDLRHFEVIAQCSQADLIPAYFCDHYVVNPIASRLILAALFKAVLDGNIDQAREVYRKARKSSAYYRGSLMHALAVRRMKQGRLDSAVAACTASIESMPKQAEFLLTKSRVHVLRKERDAAIAAATSAVQLDPTREWYQRVLREAEAS
ncbi:tetratricopeptide repeat protein [Paracoccus aestuariivivens]|uniref:Uncharacterized protein n=1 Tax=Paracoccus aestuariivivens TaxID=1820333 RepID=A0A6L6J8M9_9RHOB|nr:hypothetical protein [Paracoccus aestuariivivens]MTH78350.1 hypothetical protein [Paracoccus aestuariivivens]